MNIFTWSTKSLTSLLSIVFLVLPTLLWADGYTLQDADVEVDVNGYITSCSYDFSITDIVIPSTLDATTIVGIAAEVFYQKNITSVILPSTIEVVGSKAFYYNKLTSVTFEDNSSLRTIEALAFASNYSLSSITLPTNTNTGFVKYFNERGEFFNAGDNITDLYRKYSAQIPYTLTDADVTITDGVITACSYDFNYTDIIIPSTLNSQTVVGIKDGSGFNGVFSDNGITSVSLPSSIKTIGKYAFHTNKLIEVTFEANSNIQIIGDGAFKWNSYLNPITLPTHSSSSFVNYQDENGIKYNPGDQITDFEIVYISIAPYTLTDDDVVVTDGYIQSCSYNFDNKAIIIPVLLDAQKVIGIADYAYYGSKVFYDKGILSVEFPNTLEYIGVQSFGGNNLTVIEFPASVKFIKENSFYSNDLTKVSFASPANIEVIGSNAFYLNTGVEITLPGTHALGVDVVYKDEDGKEYLSGDVVTDVSKSITAMLPNSIGDATQWQNPEIKVTPNPTSGSISIRSSHVIEESIEVYDISGLLVKSIIVSGVESNAGICDLNDGIYFFKHKGKMIAKIIKQ